MKKFYYILITFVMCICTVTLTTSCSKSEMEEAEKYANNGNGNNGTLGNGEITLAMLNAETNIINRTFYNIYKSEGENCGDSHIKIAENGDIKFKHKHDSDEYWAVGVKSGKYKIYKVSNKEYYIEVMESEADNEDIKITSIIIKATDVVGSYVFNTNEIALK